MNAKYHIKNFRLIDFFVLIILSIFNLSCDSSTEPLEPAVITYTVSGGYAGGVYTKLVIDQSGIAALGNENPILKQKLNAQEYNSLRQSFSGFNDIPDTSMIRCMDSFIFSVEYKTEHSSKTVHIDGCELDDSTNYIVEKLKAIINKLESIVQKFRESNS